MSNLPIRAQAKLKEIKAKVEQGYSFSDLSHDNREVMMLAVQEVVEGCLGKKLNSTDHGEQDDCQTKANRANPEKLDGTLVVALKRLKGKVKDVVIHLVKLFL